MGTPFNVKIGINPISWMNDDLPSLGGETPLEVALTEGRQIGYQGFELGNKFPREPQALMEELDVGGFAAGGTAGASSLLLEAADALLAVGGSSSSGSSGAGGSSAEQLLLAGGGGGVE